MRDFRAPSVTTPPHHRQHGTTCNTDFGPADDPGGHRPINRSRLPMLAARSPDAPRSGTLRTRVVDVVHEATGTVRLKKKVDAADEMALDTRSAKTVRVTKG